MEHTNIEYFPIEELDTIIIDKCGNIIHEGNEKLVLHMKRERDSRAPKMAKALFKRRNNGKIFCEICSFDFSKTYGIIGDGFIEAHHKKPISKMQPDDVTRIEDFIMVCSNCHSMLHIGKDWISPEQLKERIILQRNFK